MSRMTWAVVSVVLTTAILGADHIPHVSAGVLAAFDGGTMLDRSLYSAINLDGTVGDGLQSAYSFTISSGG